MKYKRDEVLKNQLLDLLTSQGAHLALEEAIKGLPSEYYGATIKGAPYSLWQLLEHIRIAQYDILDYIRNPDYAAPEWPEGYWPNEKAPPSKKAWTESVRKYRADFAEIVKLLEDPTVSLFKRIPHLKNGPILLREILLIADHCSYHIGQIVLMRRILGAWED